MHGRVLSDVARDHRDLQAGERLARGGKRAVIARVSVTAPAVHALRDLLRLRMDSKLWTGAEPCAWCGRTIRCTSGRFRSPNFGMIAVTEATWSSCQTAAIRASQQRGRMLVTGRSLI